MNLEHLSRYPASTFEIPDKQKKKEGKTSLICFAYISAEQGETPSGQPLKENGVIPAPCPHQKPASVESYT